MIPANEQLRTIEDYIKSALILMGAAAFGYHYFGPPGLVFFPIAVILFVVSLVGLAAIALVWSGRYEYPSRKTNKEEA